MPRLSKPKELDLLTREATTKAEKEEQRLVKWLQDRKRLININQIEKEAGIARGISLVLANQPSRRLIQHLDKIIPIVREIGYFTNFKTPKNGAHNKV